MRTSQLFQTALAPDDRHSFFHDVRQTSERPGEPLSNADATAQAMPDASPAKWHLAHTTWFFEAVALKPYGPACKHFDEDVSFLVNSYYETRGARQPRPRRGMITRSALSHVLDYRKHVDDALDALLRRSPGHRIAERASSAVIMSSNIRSSCSPTSCIASLRIRFVRFSVILGLPPRGLLIYRRSPTELDEAIVEAATAPNRTGRAGVVLANS